VKKVALYGAGDKYRRAISSEYRHLYRSGQGGGSERPRGKRFGLKSAFHVTVHGLQKDNWIIG